MVAVGGVLDSSALASPTWSPSAGFSIALAIDAIALTIAHLVAIDRVLDAIASALESTAKTGQTRRAAAPAQKRWPWLAL